MQLGYTARQIRWHPSTHSHACKPLLVGWIVGADENERDLEDNSGDNSNGDQMMMVMEMTMTTGMMTTEMMTLTLSPTGTMRQRGQQDNSDEGMANRTTGVSEQWDNGGNRMMGC